MTFTFIVVVLLFTGGTFSMETPRFETSALCESARQTAIRQATTRKDALALITDCSDSLKNKDISVTFHLYGPRAETKK